MKIDDKELKGSLRDSDASLSDDLGSKVFDGFLERPRHSRYCQFKSFEVIDSAIHHTSKISQLQ